MGHFPQDIAAARAQSREGKTHEERQTLALEQIADTLESLRVTVLGAVTAMTAAQSRQSSFPR